jgi:hypothetical protein
MAFDGNPNPGVRANHRAWLTPRSERQGVGADDRSGAEMAGVGGLAYILGIRRRVEVSYFHKVVQNC